MKLTVEEQIRLLEVDKKFGSTEEKDIADVERELNSDADALVERLQPYWRANSLNDVEQKERGDLERLWNEAEARRRRVTRLLWN